MTDSTPLSSIAVAALFVFFGFNLQKIRAVRTFLPLRMKCPACDYEMTEMTLAGVKLDTCQGGCGGIWFDAFELQRVDDSHEVQTQYLLRIQRRAGLQVDFSRKRSCPRCDGVKLQRHFFSAKKQVEVDQCPNCGGYWLDAGELEKIRAEKKADAARMKASTDTHLSMEAIRFIYREKISQRPEAR